MTANQGSSALQVEMEGESRETGPLTSNTAKGMATTAIAKNAHVDLAGVFISKHENVRDLKSYTDESIGEMAAQIEAVGGLLQPIGIAKVKPTPATDNKDVVLVWGYRRAFALLYLAETDPKWAMHVPARVVEQGIETAGATRLLQLMENTARRDLNSMEIAMAINEAMNDKNCDFNQQDIARMLGMSTPAVSQHLKFLRFPKPVQEAISSGNVSFSAARDILYRVPETDWANAAKKAAGMTYPAFKEWVDTAWPQDGVDGDGATSSTTAAAGKQSSQKPAKMLRATDVTTKYVPFLKKQLESADKSQKVFTAADLAQAKLDAVNTVLLNPDTQLAKDINPYLKQLQVEEEKAQQDEARLKAEEDFYKLQVKRIEALYVPADPTNPDTRPNLPKVYAQVASEIFAMKPEEKAKLGFTLPSGADAADVLVSTVAKVYQDTIKERLESKKRRDEAKAKKAKEEAEAAAKKAAEGVPAPAAISA